MPELPEVECVKNSLARLKGMNFSTVTVNTHRLREMVQSDLGKRLQGRTIVDVLRKGKYLVFVLDQGYIVTHLGMTGKLLINPDAAKHDHIIFELENETRLVYNDARKFGFVLHEHDLNENKYLRNVGVEPLGDAFTADVFYNLSRRTTRPIKAFLLDQKFVTGIGNIYACELLYQLKIRPDLPTREISFSQCLMLVPAIKQMLLRSIELGGSSISDYVDADNKKGGFQSTFQVYDREVDPLGNPVVVSTISGRSTYYVPAVQR
jgi:formamidopyrimidine-DNA glycosylase